MMNDYHNARRADREMARYMMEMDVIRSERKYWEAQIKTLRHGIPDTDDWQEAAAITAVRADHVSHAKALLAFSNQIVGMLQDALQVIDSALDDPDPDWPLIETVIAQVNKQFDKWEAQNRPSTNLIFTPGIYGRC